MPRPAIVTALTAFATLAAVRADLNTLQIYTGPVGLSVDALGSAEGNAQNPLAGQIQATIPDGATVVAAYLYSAGTPFPLFSDSPRTLADYNSAGITLNGSPVNFTGLVGAVSDRPQIGQWFTARADVTSLISGALSSGKSDYSFDVSEGSLNNRIDGEVLAVVYSDPSLAQGSVVLLDGGQRTGGETKNISLGSPLGDPNAPGFDADMSLAISGSTGDNQQHSIVDINGLRLTSSAGGYDDGVFLDGGLITAGGVNDLNSNPAPPSSTNAPDDELYSLKSFVHSGDTALQIFTQNDSNDDNIFFLGLRLTAPVREVVDVPAPDAGSTLALLGTGVGGVSVFVRRKPRLA
jgi:hypothetical protein